MVASSVTVLVVDPLEVIDVDYGEGQRQVVPGGYVEGRLGQGVEHPAIVDASERISVGLQAKFSLRATAAMVVLVPVVCRIFKPYWLSFQACSGITPLMEGVAAPLLRVVSQ